MTNCSQKSLLKSFFGKRYALMQNFVDPELLRSAPAMGPSCTQQGRLAKWS